MRKEQGGRQELLGWFYTTLGWGRRCKQTDVPPGVNISWYRHLESISMSGPAWLVCFAQLIDRSRNWSFPHYRLKNKSIQKVYFMLFMFYTTILYNASSWLEGLKTLIYTSPLWCLN
jgi:hypothetical protein